MEGGNVFHARSGDACPVEINVPVFEKIAAMKIDEKVPSELADHLFIQKIQLVRPKKDN
jgi:hypothetical protein